MSDDTNQVLVRKHGEQLLDPCAKCEGCGLIANDEDQTPWKYWSEMPPESNLAVRLGLVKPVICPECGGLGKVINA